jgi:Family of unknown function (DUF5715)
VAELVGVLMGITPLSPLRTVLVLLAVFFLCTVVHCKTVNSYFPATPDSVPQENRVADSFKLKRYSNEREIREDFDKGILRPFTGGQIRCAKSLPLYRQFALPSTIAFIAGLNYEFHGDTGGGLTLDSAIRSRRDQSWLRRHNGNAASVDGPRASSHERGTTVDISRKMDANDYAALMHRLRYYRAIGLILVIEERHCVHIFVVPELRP